MSSCNVSRRRCTPPSIPQRACPPGRARLDPAARGLILILRTNMFPAGNQAEMCAARDQLADGRRRESDHRRLGDREFTTIRVDAHPHAQRQHHHRIGMAEIHVADNGHLAQAVFLTHRAAQGVSVSGDQRRLDLTTGRPRRIPASGCRQSIAASERMKRASTAGDAASSDVSRNKIVPSNSFAEGKQGVPRTQSNTSTHPPNSLPSTTPAD